MKKIDLANYTVRVMDNGAGGLVDVPYDVKKSTIDILFHQDLRLGAFELLERDKLANKINDWKNGDLLLEEAEHGKLKNAIETITGFNKNDVEFVKRILFAEQVDVEEKKG